MRGSRLPGAAIVVVVNGSGVMTQLCPAQSFDDGTSHNHEALLRDGMRSRKAEHVFSGSIDLAMVVVNLLPPQCIGAC